MKRDMIIRELKEPEFRELVLRKHKEKEFPSSDPHRMQANFTDNKNHVDFFGVEIVDKNDPHFGGFCALEVFNTKRGLTGEIRCMGTYVNARKQGLSKQTLEAVEAFAKRECPELKVILSVCNPISAKSHEALGYKVTNPGRLSSTGKLMQIRLEKVL